MSVRTWLQKIPYPRREGPKPSTVVEESGQHIVIDTSDSESWRQHGVYLGDASHPVAALQLTVTMDQKTGDVSYRNVEAVYNSDKGSPSFTRNCSYFDDNHIVSFLNGTFKKNKPGYDTYQLERGSAASSRDDVIATVGMLCDRQEISPTLAGNVMAGLESMERRAAMQHAEAAEKKGAATSGAKQFLFR